MKQLFHKINFNILYVFLAAFVLRLFLANFGTLNLDHGTFVAWGSSLSLGLRNFYNGWSDYLPGYLYILWGLSKLSGLFPYLEVVIYKLPAILADLGTAYLIYKIAQKGKGKYGLLLSILYIFNPAVLANSTLWGQVDSLTAFFAVLSLYIFPKSFILSAISLAVGTLIKPQAAFLVPAIIYLFLSSKTKITKVLSYGAVGFTVFVLGFVPFQNRENLYRFILERLTVSSGQYPYGSVNAFSFWGIFGFWKPDNITFWIGLGISLLIVSAVTAAMVLRKQKNKEYLIAAVSFLTTFLFLTRMHERHLLPALPFVLLSAIEVPSLIVVYLTLSLTYLSNLSYAYYWITDNFKEIFNRLLINIFIIVNLLSLVLTLFLTFTTKLNGKLVGLFEKIAGYFNKQVNLSDDGKFFPAKDIPQKVERWGIAVILLFSLSTRLYNLHLPANEYFDEIYHAFTAKLVLHNDPKAWEWWNPHPEGFAYEWTHPPLAKLGMVAGMAVFGENAFGWRVVQAVLGTASIFLVYLLAKALFKDRLMAVVSAGVLAFDGLFLVMSRIGMNDAYVVFFILLSLYLFIKDKYLFSSIAYGLALSSKWSAIYAAPIFLVSHFVLKKKISLNYLWFVFIPVLVYLASYTIMFTTGHSWDQFVEMQRQMWWYHTNLKAEHPYTSPAWTWPFLIRPIYLYNGPETEEIAARIYAFGNPLVFWFGIFAVILSFSLIVKEKIKRLAYVIFAYLIFFVPWIASPRIMFLYHYLPSIPFLAIVTGYVLRRFPKMIPLFFIPAAVLFVYFYPHWIGKEIPQWLDKSYYWFSSWR